MPVVDVNKHGVRLLAKSVSGACLDSSFENTALMMLTLAHLCMFH